MHGRTANHGVDLMRPFGMLAHEPTIERGLRVRHGPVPDDAVWRAQILLERPAVPPLDDAVAWMRSDADGSYHDRSPSWTTVRPLRQGGRIELARFVATGFPV